MIRTDPITEADLMYKEGYKAYNGLVYDKTGKKLTYADYTKLNKETIKALQQQTTYLSNTSDRDDYQAALDLPVECYHGKFYRDQLPMTDIEVHHLIREMNPTFTFNQILSTVRAATLYKRVDRIPEWQKPNVTGVDNGFRGNDTFYKLLKYYVYSARQDYILFIMSDGGQGKSTLTNFLKHMYQYEYYSADTKFMNQFSTASWASSRLVCFSDCTNNFIDNSHILKQISGGDDVQIEAKGIQGYSGKLDAQLLFIGNEPLSYNILDTGMQRRFVNLPWSAPTKKEAKWVDYEWSLEEIAFQLELAATYDDFDFDALQAQTIKDSLQRKSAFYYIDYVTYKATEDKPYNKDNFGNFWAMIKKHYTQAEWNNVVKAKREVECYAFEDDQASVHGGTYTSD